jgi:predicted nucleic acid-binding protein
MQTYFADAWFFIALFDRRDTHHAHARHLAKQISVHRVVTHDAVLTEVLAYFGEEGAHARTLAVEGVRRAVLFYEVIPGTRALFIRGLDRYATRLDKSYSHVDCISMILMEDLGIRFALTNDHHFAQAGFLLVNQ